MATEIWHCPSMRCGRLLVVPIVICATTQSGCGAKLAGLNEGSGPDASSKSGPPATGSPPISSGLPPTMFGYYYVDSNAIKAVPVGGGRSTVLFQGGASSGQVLTLAFDRQGVYFALSEAPVPATTGPSAQFSLNMLPPGGGPVTTLVTGLDQVAGMARSGSYLYFAAQNRADSNSGGGDPFASIERVPVATGAAYVLASVPKSVRAIVADSSYVYWTQDDPVSPNAPVVGEVMRMPLAGGAPETLAGGQHRPFAMAVDSSGLYWINQGTSDAMHACAVTDGSILRLDSSSRSPVTLVSGLVAADSVAVQNGDVYWSILNTDCQMATGGVFERDGMTGSTKMRAMALLPGSVYVDSTTLYFTSETGDPNQPVMGVTALPR